MPSPPLWTGHQRFLIIFGPPVERGSHVLSSFYCVVCVCVCVKIRHWGFGSHINPGPDNNTQHWPWSRRQALGGCHSVSVSEPTGAGRLRDSELGWHCPCRSTNNRSTWVKKNPKTKPHTSTTQHLKKKIRGHRVRLLSHKSTNTSSGRSLVIWTNVSWWGFNTNPSFKR